jgi:hypothetical protein
MYVCRVELNDKPYPNLIDKFKLYMYVYRVELNDEPYPNLIEKFKFELNFIVVESKLELEPCDFGSQFNRIPQSCCKA